MGAVRIDGRKAYRRALSAQVARLACGKLRRNIRYETIEQGKLDSAGVLQRGGDHSLLSGAADFDAAARSGKRQRHGYFGYVRQSGLYGCRWLAFELLGKWGIYIPMVLIVLYGISEVLFFGGIGWNMEINYLQTAYMHLFLKTDYEQETADAGTKESGKLPEGNGEKVIEWTADYKNPPVHCDNLSG